MGAFFATFRRGSAGRSHARVTAQFQIFFIALLFSLTFANRFGYSQASNEIPDLEDFSLEEVEVRLARPDERVKWDALVRENHYLEFKRFAGRGLRYVVAWRGRWLALAGPARSSAGRETAAGSPQTSFGACT